MSRINISKYLPNAVSTTIGLPTSGVTSNSGKSNSGIFGLFGKKNTTPIGSTIATAATTATTIKAIGSQSAGLRIASYLLAIFIVIMVILLFVHFMITPIFVLHPGDPGIIPVPGFDDGKLYWTSGQSGPIANKITPIHSSTFNYSLILDTFIENPLQFSQYPRILFSRGGLLKEKPTSDTLLGMYEHYNLVMGLLPDTNDLIVSVQNKDNNMENVIISNVPVQEPFRIGVIVMEKAMEVYINGHLSKTRSFSSPPRDVKGDILGPQGINANLAKVRNLKLWNRILKTTEIRYAKPPLSSTKQFDASQMPGSSSSCPIIQNTESKLESRIQKLSV